jgi:hypothetical protein
MIRRSPWDTHHYLDRRDDDEVRDKRIKEIIDEHKRRENERKQ